MSRSSEVLRAVAAALWGAVLVAPISGCKDEKKITPPPPPPDSAYLEQSSAANVLANLRTAYEERNFLEYGKLFSADFMFVFNPGAGGDPNNPTPQAWPRADEMESARNLFADTSVVRVTLDWSPGALETHDIFGWKVRVDEVNLNVDTRNAQGELWIYQVRGSYQIFFFREEDATLPSGKKKWTCTRWEDSPLGLVMGSDSHGSSPRSSETTWGRVKTLFR